jgi:NAD(P)-dependent dehydrogenase (short-subunit alcohol dehydrogenase family)
LSTFSREEFETALRVLDAVASDRGTLVDVEPDLRANLQRLCGQIAHPDMAERRRLIKKLRRREFAAEREQDESLRKSTGIRELRAKPVFLTPPLPPLLTTKDVPSLPPLPAAGAHDDGEVLNHDADAGAAVDDDAPRTFTKPRMCYACKAEYTTLHHFYDQMCPACGDLNYAKRAPHVDLSGRIAIVTGARVKIGYHAAILLLRNGCRVVVTTRFPRDCAERYAREPDFADWKDRLSIYGLDLRHTPSVEHFTRHMADTIPHLDFLVQNACQTVRRPPEFYAHMLSSEERARDTLPPAVRALVDDYETLRMATTKAGLLSPARLSQLPLGADDTTLRLPSSTNAAVELFPTGALDADLQQVDLRTHNSWRLSLHEVPTTELLEVLLVNAVSPFVLSSKLLPLMLKTPTRDKHIVLVSAMEGQFNRNKTSKHPHTNMAKAALNMLTRTSAQEYVRHGIHLNSVDTGWITDEDPAHIAAEKASMHRFSPPLDVVDGAARIVDPIFAGLETGEHAWGQFFKDYKPTYW